jgi:putative transposase
MDESAHPDSRRCPPRNLGLLQLIRAKREWHWKPSPEQRRRGFRGWHQRGYLPHFDAPNVTQMVTLMLADSFPVSRRMEWEPILREPDNSIKRRKLEAWLDRGHGECWLRRRAVADVVESTLLEADGKQFRFQAWVLMPNHVHLVVDVWETPLARLVGSWKGKASRLANLALGRSGPFWEQDYFDTRIRDEDHLRKAIHYTEYNPAKAAHVKDPRQWKWGSARLRDDRGRLPGQPWLHMVPERRSFPERGVHAASTTDFAGSTGKSDAAKSSHGEAA